MVEETPLIELALGWHPENRSSALAAFIRAFSDLDPSAGEQKYMYGS
ncbi:hypothetical protein ALP10_01215 [Pseudomonas syringae pv. helianthi]|uniref:Uncharacterized protein n=2 Tax=Pseudomonas syringae group genomosp. 7 TaxID=251699 RepID=A0A3M6D9P2_9PSED|nr:Unknown protein sequence [Pseudomonas syringae pv. tagetis]RMV52603.1 hypothetical protein ALP10_01215 [Pseudomonas syringae pv. helianthi]